ncbi:MAG: hypothetical protein CME71_03245 [Halobacteriovorax sp.]|nr:hypothetical protein [Halobacteriovorax sp.]|tara:strand:+ start:56 stop:442 length:387 start_codon:yes stop_codon:yes gene_type:complete
MNRLFVLALFSAFSVSTHAKTVNMVQAAKAFLGDITDEQASVAYDDPTIEEENKVSELKLKVGDKIKFMNRDEVSHNVSAIESKKKLFDVALQEPGAKNDREIELKQKGTFEVQCAIHPKMKIKLVVE